MKKLFAAGAILALALAGAPNAAAFSSMSSSSPVISQPSPKPTTPKPTTTAPKPTAPAPTTTAPKPTTPAPTTPAPAPASPAEVYAAINTGHNTAMKNRGYTWNESARKLMELYALSNPVTQPYQKDDLEARGYTVTVVEHKTSEFRKDYEELMATPTEASKYKLYGVYVVYGAETTTAYILNT